MPLLARATDTPAVAPALKRKCRRALPSRNPGPTATIPERLLEGCVLPALSPATNAAAARVLDRLGITLVRVPDAGCCGAVSLHLSAQDEAHDSVRRNIDAWWPHIQSGAEAIVSTASGCGSTIHDYAHLLAHDAAYAAKARRISELARDVSEIVIAEKSSCRPLASRLSSRLSAGVSTAFPPARPEAQGHCRNPAHGSGLQTRPVADSHLCCGSAGTYSILQPELSQRLPPTRSAH
jgi:glycolate oxidase iron-sulfur subunit